MKLTDQEIENLTKYNFKTVLAPAYERAEELGREVIYPEPNELQLDIDSEESWEQYQNMIKLLSRIIEVKSIEITPSSSEKPFHFHISIFLEKDLENDLERMLLQSVLGSDPAREIFNYHRFKENGNCDSCFFKKVTIDLPDLELELNCSEKEEEKKEKEHPWSCDCDSCNLIPQRF